ncbi:division/cell wall cluster transcriptional repressor MraZ [Mycoplasma phocoenae]|uniref:Transcriptional regulator MraZ n=1 Tax=Mycoplasma phocoenae TaxID=754517 RepID=A0A858U4X1_9MOLU|nr:division/cell wall cluster transcriptional repressor MraZ [Mycoplasma phocoenae]QJG67119.1 division/cell wall cluster transcriptional repressor MraZ [Mycoplasma phocoenae]
MYGKYERSLDEKNRLVVPAKFREELGSTFFITYGFDNSIAVRSSAEWKKMEEKLQANNSLDKDFRLLSRHILSNTEELTMDKSGRITLPSRFLDRSAIKKEIVFIGVGNMAEIFAKEAYEKQEILLNDEVNFDELAQKLYEAGVKL